MEEGAAEPGSHFNCLTPSPTRMTVEPGVKERVTAGFS